MHGDLPRLLQSQHEDMMIRFDHQQDAQHCGDCVSGMCSAVTVGSVWFATKLFTVGVFL